VNQCMVVRSKLACSKKLFIERSEVMSERHIDRYILATMIDQSLLKPEATREEIEAMCHEADQYGFAAVFVNSYYTKLCSDLLAQSKVKVGTVSGFPLGACATEVKVGEAAYGVENGAEEIDMVMNVGALKAGDDIFVEQDIRSVVEKCKERAIVKVILETSLLTDEEKRRACEIAQKAGADFVKTSTGFGPGGATVGDVVLMRQVVGETMGVKASGGIRDYTTAVALVQAGASRIGTSAGVEIVSG
jgi:deoxyribose-phosphate aldolase